MPKCYRCQEEVFQLFHCDECDQNYCSLHKVPKDNDCNLVKDKSIPNPYESTQQIFTTNAQQPQTQPQTSIHQEQVTPGVTRGTTDGSYTWYRPETLIPENAFSPDSGIDFRGILFPYKSEFVHLVIGCSIIYLIGLLSFYNPNFQASLEYFNMGWALFMLAGIYMTAFLFHELGHRQVAKHFKFPTKFRLLTYGMILTTVSFLTATLSIMTTISIPSPALPGAVVVLGLEKVSKETGLCKAAGPIVNLVYGVILLIISFLIPRSLYPFNYLICIAAGFNFTLGGFNMIPIGILDGQNILKWSKVVYILLAGIIGVFLLIVITIQLNQSLVIALFY